MNRRKGLAEDIKKIYFCDTTDEKKDQAILLFHKLDDYYKIYDLDNNTNFSKIFECLYMSKKYLTDMAIARRTYISVDTLRKYVGKYNRLIGLLIERLNLKL